MIHYKHIFLKRTYLMLTMLFGVANVQFSIFNFQLGLVSAQISIGGNVYGGGNEGETGGNTTVTIRNGIIGNVFGGARMADVGGRAFVNLDGQNSSGMILISSVYGGNDISGTVGTDLDPSDTGVDKLPTELTNVLQSGETTVTHPEKNAIDNTWSACIRSSKMATEYLTSDEDANCILVGSVFGGGNGDYTYTDENGNPLQDANGKYIVKSGDEVIATSGTSFSAPTLAKTYLEINGGCLSQVYGGGNAATVTESTVISMQNTSKGLQSLLTTSDPAALTTLLGRLSAYTGIATFQGDYTSLDYTSSRVFGGNNKATMAIHPHWNLQQGLIRDLYSGGNQGDMTNTWGLLLDIPATSTIKVENVFGGCRRADVHPAVSDAAIPEIQIPVGHTQPNGAPYQFPKGYSARLVIRGGDVRNVYGGNDISGNIWGGSAVGVYTSIRGDVYGAGNGSYGYTDNSNLKDVPGYGDFYYDVKSILGLSGSSFSGTQSAQALTKHRPNSERVSLRLWGRDAAHPTIIGGSVYVGGNSATLENDHDPDALARGELKIGSNVYVNNVFLGNNGENMVKADILQHYKNSVNGEAFSQMDLTDSGEFAEYMKGCASSIRPSVVFDNMGNGDPDTYIDFTSYFGSFFCGGNVGSTMWGGTTELNFNRHIVIFNKLVAGCNDAFVPAVAGLNAEYKGGVLGSAAEQAAHGMEETVDGVTRIKDSHILNLSGIKIEPKRWVVKRDGSYNPILTNGKVTYLAETCGCELTTINDVCTTHGNHVYLEWNTIDRTGPEVAPVTSGLPANGVSTTDDLDRRLQGGNIYGGCYNSGVVNGSVVINVDNTLMDPSTLFDRVGEDEQGEAILYGAGGLNDLLSQDRQNFNILERRTGVILGRQGMDVLGKALNIFGGGFGKDTEIWGSTTINLNAGYVFQIFGGSEKGVIGKPSDGETGATESVTFNGNTYLRNSKYSCTVNVRGTRAGVSKQDDSSEDMAEAEFIYGGGFLGPICGNTTINLGNGRVFNTFAGSCMADILGHTETYMGRQVNKQSLETGEGFPYVRDYIYCGNDLGGAVKGQAEFVGRVREESIDDDSHTTKSVIQAATAHTANVTKASAYVEYRQGRTEGIFGGCFGTYDYTDPYFGEYFYASGATDINAAHPAGSARDGYTKPRMISAFVNFRPTDTEALRTNKYNFVNEIYGAGQGYPGDADRDIMQKSSYVLIDIPQGMTNFLNMKVFGAGAWSGVGMDEKLVNKTATEIAALDTDAKTAYYTSLDSKSAVIDLVRGQIGAAYGGSYAEGVTRRTMVNVPQYSTIRIGSIFGGACGTETYMPCDVYEGNVEYHSANATLICNPERLDDNGNTVGNALHNGAIYGGNNNERRTLYTKVNIDVRVNQDHYQYGMTRGNVFGAGLGGNTWAEYTEVNLNSGAEVYEVYGGGQAGKVFCAEAISAYKALTPPTVWPAGSVKEGETFTDADFVNAWKIGGGYDAPSGTAYWMNPATNLQNPLVRLGEADDRDWDHLHQEDIDLIVNKYNTNVIIREGAYVANYGYAAGLGADALVGGHTYIALLGGVVNKDIYAGGTSGSVQDTFGAENYSVTNREGFEATTTAYIESGTVRNVYGGGWRGSVGYHPGAISDSNDHDILGQSHVVVGKVGGTGYLDGIPAVTRNVYGGGEGGSIYGTAYVKINNGYIGYRYKNTAAANETPVYEYVPELDDAAVGDNLLDKGGNVFGGGYVANSYVDFSDVQMFGGTVRGCLFGGGEIGPIGRGTTKNAPEGIIYKAGKSYVTMYGGHVLRDVFGGGRGYDNWNGEGWMSEEEKLTMDLSSKGYVFGKTLVFIRGGEIGTEDGVAQGFGNVFGGGDRGFIFGAYDGGRAKKSGVRYNVGLTSGDDGYDDQGYYYKHDGSDFVLAGTEKQLTEDCKVVIGPQCKVKAGQSVTLEGIFYPKKAPIPTLDVKWLKREDENRTDFDADGIVTAENGITIASRTYEAGDYVPTYALQTLKSKTNDATQWAKLEDDGVIIHNAVFAGGNVSSGDDQVYANAPTVFGNATASIHDLYHRDLITIGTGHVGGLYGDGNLTFVDGYRGLNITNYGTDYYNLQEDITFTAYNNLNEREKAYYELRYKCVTPCTDKQNKTYTAGEKPDMLTYSDLLVLFEDVQVNGVYIVDPNTHEVNSTYWQQNGVCSRYAGRIMNTIQRADFCGVFGSRLVLQGAPDRVPETVDYTNYTINRVREVSLNKKESIIPSDLLYTLPATYSSTDYNNYYRFHTHGNYFGIYSIVNHLGAITSDVNMNDKRVTGNSDYANHTDNGGDDETYIQYKKYCYEHPTYKRNRNRGSSYNKVALASGVYLELTTELSTGKNFEDIDWGYITGVVELDLINVQTGVGGGYVYAKNVHGVRTPTNYKHITLTALNNDAVTRRDYTYSDDANPNDNGIVEWETSGNFIHDTQTIIDDCYNVSGKYKGSDRSPAHFWYIKGQVYVYEQYISAYTGAPAAYKETVNIPLTITAASHGQLNLVNIQPNHYAYYKSHNVPLTSSDKLELNNVTYELNDPIDFWSWSLLTPTEQALFVSETYTTIADCKIGNTPYPAGTVLLPADLTTLRSSVSTDVVANVENVPAETMATATASTTVPYVTQEITDDHGNTITKKVAFDFIFRQTNNISHDTGYILTYGVDNPMKWNEWYTPISGPSSTGKIDFDTYHDLTSGQDNYYNGPTYSVKSASDEGIYGQRTYEVSNIIDHSVYTSYQTLTSNYSTAVGNLATQAEFEPAYVVTVNELETQDKNNNSQRLYNGSALAQGNYTSAQWDALSSSVAQAFVSTATIQLSNTEYIYTGDLMTAARRTELINAAHNAGNTELETMLTNSIVEAYYCTKKGLYGGNYYAQGTNYRALEAWSSMSPADRTHFAFNYDALDVLIDPDYSGTQGQKYQYDDAAATLAAAQANLAQYSLVRPVDYTARYDGSDSFTYTYNNATKTVTNGVELSREEYEAIPNEQCHYVAITVAEAGNIYVVNRNFIQGDTPYTAGQTISADTYNHLGANQSDVHVLTFDSGDEGKTFYYCRSSYEVNEHGEGQPVKAVKAVTSVAAVGDTKTSGQTVPVGFVISADGEDGSYTYGYRSLVNKQLNFSVHGVAPVETSTLYVSRNSDIYDLSKEKIITVIYQYDYEESDDTGMHITPVSERHIVNIHLQFKSGVPTVENITEPDLVLPGTNIVIRQPNVTPGAYEVLGGGWEIYRNGTDADNHSNGTPYSPSLDPLYWYQDGYYVAYYAKTYLGKTFSNAVAVSVANYHDLKKVMDAKDHHYYIDNADVKRDPKIYINDYATDDPATTANGLTLLKDFFDLSLNQRTYTVNDGIQTANYISDDPSNKFYQHVGVETSQIGGCKNLEFFLRSDLAAPSGWTPIGNDNSNQCFQGILHGDGHTITGLDNSLFGHLCGEVYNLGVTGSFTTAGIADEGSGFVENSWVKSSATATADTKAVFHNPTNTATRTNHIVNCYYPNTSGYTAQAGTTAKSESAFYNGEVTYDLNEFYLFKRYSDQTVQSGNDYSYWKDVNGTLTKQTGHYPAINEGPYLVNDDKGNYLGSYVESRFADGDFVYAAGTIPGSADKRYWTETRTENNKEVVYTGWAPIWPDDYLFFGQMLTYGHVAAAARAHQPLPSVIIKNGDRLPNASSSVFSNRVYRAPAYYRSLTMGMAHFNPNVVLAQTKVDDATLIAHKNMTAIDFTGTNGDLASGYQKGVQSAEAATSSVPGGLPERFYPPLLDDDGIFSMQNIDLTRNLLVYTGTTGGTGSGQTPTASQQTANVVSAYFLDKAYAEDNATGTGYVAGKAAYRTVDVYDTHSNSVLGHWVQGNGGTYTALRDHLLVDKNDFNAPVSYTFDSGKRMWYQRTPDTFVDRKKGWEAISLPFSAEIVTTQQKGELTHFYKTTRTDSKGVNVGSAGHEYWLRQFAGDLQQAKDANNNDIAGVFTAAFEYPAAGSNEKVYTNTFLWDYYYQYAYNDPREDKNSDQYQQEYYATSKTYSDYPYSAAGTPYIIGFPGTTYYEFDLSGTFVPDNTHEDQVPARLAKQTVTFASPTGTTINVSDTETATAKVTDDTSGYTFHPSYLNENFDAGTSTFTLKANYDSDNNGTDDCSSFVKVPATGDATNVYAFRPYFSYKAPSSSRSAAWEASMIVFGNTTDIDEDMAPKMDELAGRLSIYAKRNKVVVESYSTTENVVRITNAAGIIIATFTIQPGETVETRIYNTGVYLVNTSAGISKKLRVGSR